MIPRLEHVRHRLGALHAVLVADTRYGSEENCAHLEGCDVQAFMGYGMFHKEQKRAFKGHPTQPRNWAFDGDADEWTCAGGRKRAFQRERKEGSGLSNESTTRAYRCADCGGCPHQGKCSKGDDRSKSRAIYVIPVRDAYRRRAERRLTSDEGIVLRKRRPPGTETVFDDIKQNWCFKRFALRGPEKASLEWGLEVLGHNVRKLFEAVNRESAAKQATERA